MMKKETKFKIVSVLITLVVVALLMWFTFSGENADILKSLFSDDLTNDQLQARLRDFGLRGYITTAVLAMLQLVCTVLPAEPVQMLAGLTFGFPVGLLCCTVGVFLGATAIYMVQNVFGKQLRWVFNKTLRLDVEGLANAHKDKCSIIVFLLYFAPVIPYGMICFFAASLGLSYRRYIVVNLVGAIPSVCIGVALGYMTISTNWVVTVCVFALFAIFVGVMLYNRKWFFRKLNAFIAKPPYSSKTKVRKCNRLLLTVCYYGARLGYACKGIRIKATNKCKKQPEAPCIVLCNHGSFIDFLYAERLLRKSRPHFIAARLYFYHRILGRLMKYLGAFPKSMFALDVESVKNSVKVLRDGEVLAMMPEARLSTVGRFEDIQESTFSFLKKSQVPVYTIKINGGYLAKPKWGKGIRHGARVEVELDILFTAQQIQELTEAQIKQGVEQRLYYDELAWLEEHPNLHYRSKQLAEGLENILAICPKCKGRHCITTKGNQVFCETCGLLTEMSDRYGFDEGFAFENFAKWYDWQKEEFRREILENPDFALTSQVEFRLPGNGQTLTRHAGEGVCTLTRQGLTYKGTRDGEDYEISFSLSKIYRLLFGAGENFEVYNGNEILYFVPTERRSAVDWYISSMILHDET